MNIVAEVIVVEVVVDMVMVMVVDVVEVVVVLGMISLFFDWEPFEDGKMVKNFKILICYHSNLNIQVPKNV